MNPELDQDDINIEEFLYPCLNDKNEKGRTRGSLKFFHKPKGQYPISMLWDFLNALSLDKNVLGSIT